MGNFACIGGGGGGSKEACPGGEEGAVVDGGHGNIEEVGAGVEAGDGGDGGGGGEGCPNVTFRAFSSSPPRSFSGVGSLSITPGGEAERRADTWPLLLAMTAAL